MDQSIKNLPKESNLHIADNDEKTEYLKLRLFDLFNDEYTKGFPPSIIDAFDFIFDELAIVYSPTKDHFVMGIKKLKDVVLPTIGQRIQITKQIDKFDVGDILYIFDISITKVKVTASVHSANNKTTSDFVLHGERFVNRHETWKIVSDEATVFEKMYIETTLKHFFKEDNTCAHCKTWTGIRSETWNHTEDCIIPKLVARAKELGMDI